MSTPQTTPQNVESNSTQPTVAQRSVVNYSRWMTDNATAIANMKLYQLALPSAHNAGMDTSHLWGLEELWAACQTNSFGFQLEAGARVLDLRLYDASYKKLVGNHSPTWIFKEEFVFNHAIVTGRTLQSCIDEVREFSTKNPGEIIILDIHQYDRGKYASDSVTRCLKYFNPILEMLIPPSAANLTIGEIRAKFSRQNIIIAWGHGNGFWGTLRHAWLNKDSVSESDIVEFCNTMMAEPLPNLWSLSATAYNSSGPAVLNSSHRLWGNTVFKPGQQTGNIINVDFIERTGIVDRCIALNIARGQDTTLPVAPNDLTITQLIDNGKPVEAASFKWSRGTDNTGVVGHQIYQDEHLFFSTNENEYSTNVLARPYNYTIRAFDIMGNISAPSSKVFSHLKDNIPPTKPGGPLIRNISFYTISIFWDESQDSAGIKGYEIQKNGAFLDFVDGVEYTLTNLNPAEYASIKVCARDWSNNSSEWANMSIPQRPMVPQRNEISVKTFTESQVMYIGWLITNNALAKFTIIITLDGTIIKTEPVGEFTSGFSFSHKTPTDRDLTFGIQYVMNYGTDKEERSETTEYTVCFNKLTAPDNLEGSSIAPGSFTLTWCPSTDTRLTGYAISRNEEAPVLVPSSPCSYTATNINPDSTTDYLYEVWAIDENTDNVSAPISINLSYAPPTTPGIPELIALGHSSASLIWAPSSGVGPIRYKIYLNGVLVRQTNHPSAELNYLRTSTHYLVEVRAVNRIGTSQPSPKAFKTLLRPPTNLKLKHNSGTCRLSWDPIFARSPTHEGTINGQPFTAGALGHSFNLEQFSPGEPPHHFTFMVKTILDGATSETTTFNTVLDDVTPPTQPGKPLISHITNNSAYVSWTSASDNTGVTRYKLVRNGISVRYTPTNELTLDKIASGQVHSVYVRAEDKDGNLSLASERTVFRTTGTAPVYPSPSASIKALTSTTARLDWSHAPDALYPAGVMIMVDGYHYETSLITNSAVLRDLIPGFTYIVELFSFDAVGAMSEPTTLHYEPKYITPPSMPTNLKTTESTSNSSTFTWDAATDDTRALEYVIYLEDVYFDSTPLTQYTVFLLPGEYNIKICAMDLFGNISETASIAVIIEGELPSAPSNFRYTQTSLIPIPTLEWDKSSGDVLEYDIAITGPLGSTSHYFTALTFTKPVLLPRTRYDVTITARNENGHSSPLISEFTTK
ncbi:hypothetical protein PMI35_00613 [Pseudomonas sp. GM78]|uniref:hypothetical protein n=1 Tax=Pseudomonas sp. GM78 TaxID=1144337 RepID=UPI00026F7CFE|nr:hypothetical protein [Pseudomonas sp. GM78]EJN34085.1 hypothetical protein PMI35_00613 [Pseudomonas sp. GM78]